MEKRTEYGEGRAYNSLWFWWFFPLLYLCALDARHFYRCPMQPVFHFIDHFLSDWCGCFDGKITRNEMNALRMTSTLECLRWRVDLQLFLVFDNFILFSFGTGVELRGWYSKLSDAPIYLETMIIFAWKLKCIQRNQSQIRFVQFKHLNSKRCSISMNKLLKWFVLVEYSLVSIFVSSNYFAFSLLAEDEKGMVGKT